MGIDINPEFIEQMLQGYLGGTGTFINNVMQTVSSVITNEEIVMDNVPVVQRFIGNARYDRERSKYFANIDQVNLRKEAMRGAGVDFRKNNFTTPEQIKWAREIQLFDNYQKQIKQINEMLQYGKNSDGKPFTDKEIEYFENQIELLTKEANKVME